MGLSYLWNPHYLTSVTYQHSVSGNLGHDLDRGAPRPLWRHVNLFAGAAYGPVAPAIILNFQTGLEIPRASSRRVCRSVQALSAPAQRADSRGRLPGFGRSKAFHVDAQLYFPCGSCGACAVMKWIRQRNFGSLPTIVVLIVVLAAGSRLIYLSVQHHAAMARETAATVAATFVKNIEPALQKLAALASRQAAAAGAGLVELASTGCTAGGARRPPTPFG